MARSLTTSLALVVSACGGGDRPFDYCQADRPPDPVCYREKRDPTSANIQLAEAIAAKQMQDHPADTLAWDWQEAVLMVGIHELYRVTENEALRDYYRAWMDHHISNGYAICTSDTSSPARLAVELYAQSGDGRYRQVLEDFFTYIDEDALRTEDGGLNHWGTDGTLGVSLWVDSLFMFGGVLIRWGEQENDEPALGEFSSQHAIFTELLQRPSGWYKHAWGWPGQQEENVFWGRGNGWVAAATIDYLRVRLARREEDAAVDLAFGNLLRAILAAQDPESGLWWTVANRPGETYLETSATALFAYALARAYRFGFADESVLAAVASAVAGVRSRIQPDAQDRPVVTGISGPTMPSTFDYYAGVPVQNDLAFGLGAVLLMLVETSGLP